MLLTLSRFYAAVNAAQCGNAFVNMKETFGKVLNDKRPDLFHLFDENDMDKTIERIERDWYQGQ
jgi:hypothetical protein